MCLARKFRCKLWLRVPTKRSGSNQVRRCHVSCCYQCNVSFMGLARKLRCTGKLWLRVPTKRSGSNQALWQRCKARHRFARFM
ncbi:uncharacterized protein LOC144782118 isoform X2 [Lissotriton helveticus]